MSKWVECFADKERQKERFACTGCDAIVDASHKDGPPNDLCHCEKKIIYIPNQEYRNNYDLIQWTKN